MLGFLFPLWYTSLGQATAAMAPNAEIAAVAFSFLFSFVSTLSARPVFFRSHFINLDVQRRRSSASQPAWMVEMDVPRFALHVFDRSECHCESYVPHTDILFPIGNVGARYIHSHIVFASLFLKPFSDRQSAYGLQSRRVVEDGSALRTNLRRIPQELHVVCGWLPDQPKRHLGMRVLLHRYHRSGKLLIIPP